MSEVISRELERLDSMKTETEAMEPIARIAESAAAAFPELNLEVSVVRRAASKPFINLRATVDGFRQAVPVLQWLAKKGWHTDKSCPFTDEHSLERREYNLCERGEFPETVNPITGEINQVDGWFRPYRFKLMLFLKTDSKECRRVQVGTKEEPVYEFVCD